VSKWPDDHPKVQSIEKSLMDRIIVDMLPYSLVKRLNFADPGGVRRYELKTEKFFNIADAGELQEIRSTCSQTSI
jgi:hypothetical protein